MTAGDIWVRSPAAWTRISPAGSVLANVAVASGYEDFNNPPCGVHDGASLWTVSQSLPSGAAGRLHRYDPGSLAVLESFRPLDQSSEFLNYYSGVSVRGNGDVVAHDSDPWAMELDHAGVKVQEVGDPTFTASNPYQRRGTIAPGGGSIVFESSDNQFAQTYVDITSWDLDTNTRVTVHVDKPGANANDPGTWNVAAKPDGGFWLSWSGVTGADAGAVITEHAAGGTMLQRVNFPNTDPYYDEVTGIDVDAHGNLIALMSIFESAHSPNYWLQLARIPAAGAGSYTLFGDEFDPSDFDGSTGGVLFALHVQRAFGPSSPPWLRQMQRDDVTRQYARNGPTSVQASIRQGPAGTYL